ncbi:4-alpha-glucanotransferase [Streptomyces diastatochromogenes]|nr:4-alpha-glucanotransferase [Streptomyces diastatochromogenes]
MPGPSRRSYGLLVQLYSLLSTRSWGMGDLGDLRELVSWAGRAHGAGFVQVNPLHAGVPGAPSDPSRTGRPPAASRTPSTCGSRRSPSTPWWAPSAARSSTGSSRRPPNCANGSSARAP